VAYFLLNAQNTQRLDALPETLPTQGFVWWAISRAELEAGWTDFQTQLQRLGLEPVIELHQQDLTNAQHPSHYDYTSRYDVVIFRRLLLGGADTDAEPAKSSKKAGPTILQQIATVPVGFLLYDRLLVTVHSDSCSTADDFTRRVGSDSNNRRPTSPADLMLRMVNTMVDSYLELRKTLTAQIDHWQTELLHPNTRTVNWRALLSVRNELHALEDLCDEQHDAIQEWLDTLQEQPLGDASASRNERDNLVARSRDVIEHIERVVHHVRRLEQSAETAVQIYFGAQSNRTNGIMRTLTAVTAVFLPLNLITGFFGMNFEFMPFIHNKAGFWWALAAMVMVATTLIIVFWRKRYLARTRS
jgi:magnesium transporter